MTRYLVAKAEAAKQGHEMPVIASLADVELDDIEAGDVAGRTPRFIINPAYGGGKLPIAKYDLPVIVDLANLQVNEQSVQAVLFHEEQRLVGHVDSVTNDGRTLSLSGPCSGLKTVVDEFVDSARNKFPWKASIEARPLDRPEMIPAGEFVAVNGQTHTGPCLVVRRAELYGVSFVPRGADENTVVSIAAKSAGARVAADVAPEQKTLGQRLLSKLIRR